MPGAIKGAKATALNQVQAIIDGTTRNFPGGSFVVLNTTYGTAALTAKLQVLADAITTLNEAQATVKDALLALRAAVVEVGPLLKAYRRLLYGMYGNSATAMAEYGLAPEQARTPLTAEQQAAAVAKARATRVARGTKSLKQRLAIKGEVTGVIITPVIAKDPGSNS